MNNFLVHHWYDCITDNVHPPVTKNVSSKMCGAPVRNQTLKPLLVGVIGGGLALLVFILRMCAGLPVGGRPLGWDDYTICIAVALGTPPTVFSVLCKS